jgi:hypothetical protein
MKANNLKVYCVVVPTKKPTSTGDKPIRTRHHRVWDAYVRKITGGLTIFAPGKGQWISPANELVEEKVIPVNIACTEEQFKRIVSFTLKHYRQDVVMAYKVSDEVYFFTEDDV